jgi:LPXTG-site transpeptidase (sortase) family protein
MKQRKHKLPLNRAIQVPHKRRFNVKRTVTFWVKILLIVGPLLIAISLGMFVNQTIQLSFFTPHIAETKKPTARHQPIPTGITIPKVGIDLPVEQTSIDHGVWQIADNGASHLDISANPGELGPIILFSHNTNQRFGPIRWLSKGDKVNIKTADGKIFTYNIIQTLTVQPDKTDVFTKYPGETLILYTCDGFADLERFIVIAKPTQ